MDEAAVEPLPDMLDLVAELKAAGITAFPVNNIDRSPAPYVELEGGLDGFKKFMIASRASVAFYQYIDLTEFQRIPEFMASTMGEDVAARLYEEIVVYNDRLEFFTYDGPVYLRIVAPVQGVLAGVTICEPGMEDFPLESSDAFDRIVAELGPEPEPEPGEITKIVTKKLC